MGEGHDSENRLRPCDETNCTCCAWSPLLVRASEGPLACHLQGCPLGVIQRCLDEFKLHVSIFSPLSCCRLESLRSL